MQAVRDTTSPQGPWEFDESVTLAFDDMLARSIPDYANMRRLVCALALRSSPATYIDLGCSRGGAIADLLSVTGAKDTFIGWEISPPMVQASVERFAPDDRVTIEARDLRDTLPAIRADTVLSVLTLQFTPIEHRLRIVGEIFERLLPGGCLLLVEKILGSTAKLDRLLVDRYYDQKRGAGYSEEDIERKRLSLEGVLVPVTARWNEDLLRGAGFLHIECFWRALNFAGWVAIKDE
jgi:tRNA (cmo5U34)-methyltransferase|tara:strand:- start:753 stop:1460 length:708 start_codon:yes stop_codon:yes gene_type:complete